jgi:hypothetical protein
MCQYFMRPVLDAASTGRAALEARQMFIHHKSALDPYDLKTLAQYNLLGDPSIHPIRATGEHGIVKVLMGSKMATGAAASVAGRRHRRERLERFGIALGSIVRTAAAKKAFSGSKAIRGALDAEVAKEQLGNVQFSTHSVTGPASFAPSPRAKTARHGKAIPGINTNITGPTFHIAIGSRPGQLSVPQYVVIVASEDENQTIIRKGFSR